MKTTLIFLLLISVALCTKWNFGRINSDSCVKCFNKKDFVRRHSCLARCFTRKSRGLVKLSRCVGRCNKYKKKKKFCQAACNAQRIFKICRKRIRKSCRKLKNLIKRRACFKRGYKVCYKYRNARNKLRAIVKKKYCKHDMSCGPKFFCSNKGNLVHGHGFCRKRYKGFCRDNTQCKSHHFCLIRSEIAHGKCVTRSEQNKKLHLHKFDTKPSKGKGGASTLRFMSDFKSTMEFMEGDEDEDETAAEKSNNEDAFVCGSTGMDDVVRDLDRSNTLAIPRCGINKCDDPNFRNRYTSKLNVRVNIEFHIVTHRGSNYRTDFNNVVKSFHALNRAFAPVGISFHGKVMKNGAATRYLHTSDPDALAKAAIHRYYTYAGKIFAFYDSKRSGGRASFPWSAGKHCALWFGPTGSIVDKVFVHEMGHIFGLWHTFHGVSEIRGCSLCKERHTRSSATSGDFCSDTNAGPRSRSCSRVVSSRPTCSGQTTRWHHTVNNFMSYTLACPRVTSVFTAQQIRRMRCYYKNEFKRLRAGYRGCGKKPRGYIQNGKMCLSGRWY